MFLTVYTDKNAQGVADGLVHTYYIATSSIAALSVTAGTANFSAKANVSEIVTDGQGNVVSTTALDSGAIMMLTIVDGPPGTPDQVAMTVNMSKARGGVWYSSLWTGTSTALKAVTGGDAVVK